MKHRKSKVRYLQSAPNLHSGLPNHMSFWHLYLWHALNSQFWDSIPSLESSYLVETIIGQDSKKLISMFYNHLMLPTAIALAYQLKSRWTVDVGEVADEEWEEVLETCKSVSPKLSDCLPHLYILHWSYLTPTHLSKYQLDYNPACQVWRFPGVHFTTCYGPTPLSKGTGHRWSNFFMTEWAPL